MLAGFFRDVGDFFRGVDDGWKEAGVGAGCRAFNLALLALAWTVLPLERSPLNVLVSERGRLFPQVDFNRIRWLDFLRIGIQLLFLAVTASGLSRLGPPGPDSIPVRAWKSANYFLDLLGGGFSRLLRALGRGADRVAMDEAAVTPLAGMILAWVLGLAAAALAALCITQPFDTGGQVLFLSVMLCLALVLSRSGARLALMLLFVISIVVSARYLWWRCTSTLNIDSDIGFFLGILLLGSEIYAFMVMVLGYFQVCWVLDRRPAPMPADRSSWPSVDIFIPTYNEPEAVVKPALLAATCLDWPPEKLRVYLLDDGCRPSFRALAEAAGAGYIIRDEHRHAKAGNINHALEVTGGDFIAIFDCDHVPSADFLTRTAGWLVRDPGIALVQTPHHFYSRDPFEKNWHLGGDVPGENSLFHDFIQKGNDTWNATMFCGSSALMRRKALLEIGGIAIETVTEDAHSSLKLSSRGWSTAFIETPLASGLATETLASHIGQRIRWARGMIQVFRLDNPLFKRGLALPQRLCYFNAMLHFLHGLPRLVFLLAPLPFLFFDIHIIYAAALPIFSFVLPHMIHSAVTNQVLQRGRRMPFLGVVYETVLSAYILLPTLAALVFPHLGKFNVTAKGAGNRVKHLDWSISKPFLVILALNAAGLAAAFWRACFSPAPELFALAVNGIWVAYNLVVLGAAMAAAVEEVEPEILPRVALGVSGRIADAAGRECPAEILSFNQLGVRVSRRRGSPAPASVVIPFEGGERRFAVKGVSPAEGGVDLELDLPDMASQREFTRATFARAGLWAERAAAAPAEGSLTAGFRLLLGLSAYGYRSMIEFLPGRLGAVSVLVLWLASFVPRRARPA